MSIDRNGRGGRLYLVAILLIAALLRFYRIGAQSFWTDELLSFNSAAAPEGVSFWMKLLYNVHGPLHSLLIHVLRYFSESEGFLRAPSALAGIASVFLIYRWLAMLGRRDIAPYGALLLAVNPFSLYYSQELRYYSLMTMFVIIALIIYERYLDEPSYRRGALLGIALAAAALSHFSALFLAVGLAVHLLVTGRLKGRHLATGLFAAFVLIVLVSPWIYREIMFLRGINVVRISELPVNERLRGELTLNIWSYPYALYAFSVGYSFGPSLRELHEVYSAVTLLGAYWREMVLTGLLFGGLTLAGLWNAGRKGRLSLFLSVMLTAVVLTTLAAAFNIKVFNIRYMMASFPVYLAVVAYGLPSARVPRLLLLGAACAVMIASSWNYHSDPSYARDDIRSAVGVIEEGERDGDMLLAVNSSRVIEHYYGGRNRLLLLVPEWIGADSTRAKVGEYTSEYRRIWYLRCRHWDTDPDDTVLSALESMSRADGRWSFPGVELFLFEGEGEREPPR